MLFDRVDAEWWVFTFTSKCTLPLGDLHLPSIGTRYSNVFAHGARAGALHRHPDAAGS